MIQYRDCRPGTPLTQTVLRLSFYQAYTKVPKKIQGRRLPSLRQAPEQNSGTPLLIALDSSPRVKYFMATRDTINSIHLPPPGYSTTTIDGPTAVISFSGG
jgi:hypothetical protein